MMNKLFKFGGKKIDGIDPDELRRATRPEQSHRVRTPGETQEYAERLHELAVLSLFLHSAGTLEEMLSMFLERSRPATGAIVTYPLLHDRRRDVLVADRLAEIQDPGIEQASMAANESLADLEYPLALRSWRRLVMEGGEVAVTDDLRDVMEDVVGREACDQIKSKLEITRVAVVPLVMEGEAFGLCVFMFTRMEPDIEILELAVGQCTLAIKSLLVGEEATRFGGIDPVTWSHSRGFFLEALEVEVVRAQRYNRGLSLILFDIDDFTAFNENYGHSMGDRLLRSVAMGLAGCVSMPELVARYGGDDFAVLLPESNRAAAVGLASIMVDRLASMQVFDLGANGANGASVSVSVVSYPEDGNSRDELLAAAELGLEQAKEEKRQANAPVRHLSDVQHLRLNGKKSTAS